MKKFMLIAAAGLLFTGISTVKAGTAENTAVSERESVKKGLKNGIKNSKKNGDKK